MATAKMTLDQFQKTLQRAVLEIAREVKFAAEQIGEDAAEYAKAKLGYYQQAVGPYRAWPPLSPVTIERRMRDGINADDPLYATGAMHDSIFHLEEVEGLGFTVHLASDSPYAPYQELGTVDMPPRPFLGPTVFERAPIYAEVTGMQIVASILTASEAVSGQAADFGGVHLNILRRL